MLDPAQRSSWQRAQEVWQESGVTWERTAPELADSDPAADWFPDADEPPEPAAYEPPSASTWPTRPEPAIPEPAGFEPSAVGARPTHPEPAIPEAAAYEPSTASAWTGYAEPEGSDG